MGTFTGAKILHLDHFKEFPEAVKKLPESMKEVPMVSFCTGGVRCEKAAPLLEREGFRTVYQLDGGILKYFEECGGAHYEGECFVFDKRVGVDPALQETGSQLCFACQEPLKAEELLDPRYVYEVSCPSCFEKMATEERERE
jgi:predicted sulfurtransferase